ncbi:MAG: helix-turn-helix domain-containing protein [Catenibacillus sp.]
MNDSIKSNVIYRCIGNNLKEGIIACGYMAKPTADRSQYNFMNEFYSCFVLLQGSGTYITTDGRRLPIEAGDLVQRLPGIRHSTQVNPDGQWLEFFLSFGKSIFENLCKLHIVTEQPVQKACLLESDPADFSNLIKALKSASKEELPEALLKLQSTVLKLYGFGRPAACTSHIRERLPVHVNQDINPSMEQACERLSRDFEAEISLESVAKSLHMSYESFRKSFKTYTGKSPARYRTEQKVGQAMMMLESGLPIKEAARLTGYSDVYAFTKQFTKTCGMPPGKYIQNRLK